MGLLACNSCKKEISDSAKACPHCGGIPPYRFDWSTFFVLLIAAYYAAAFLPAGLEIAGFLPRDTINHLLALNWIYPGGVMFVVALAGTHHVSRNAQDTYKVIG